MNNTMTTEELDKLEAKAGRGEYITKAEQFALIAQARASMPADEQAEPSIKTWGERLPLCPDEHQVRAAMEAEIADLRALVESQTFDLDSYEKLCQHNDRTKDDLRKALAAPTAAVVPSKMIPPPNAAMLRWALRELLGALPERRDWFNPDAEEVLRDVLKELAAMSAAPAVEKE